MNNENTPAAKEINHRMDTKIIEDLEYQWRLEKDTHNNVCLWLNNKRIMLARESGQIDFYTDRINDLGLRVKIPKRYGV